MMKALFIFWFSIIFVFMGFHRGFSQPHQITFRADIPADDKCGFDAEFSRKLLLATGDHWGYGYDSLLLDLEHWSFNSHVRIDSIGASVQNRAIWQLTMPAERSSTGDVRTVFVHARTHPGEVQSWWVTDALIQLLISEDEFAEFMRERCNFYIIPMYNPDGVELEYPRENANMVDLERDWDKNPMQPESAALKWRFSQLMSSEEPIEVALNMHSSTACTRFFVYHDSVGTSSYFTLLEQDFIGDVRNYYPEGIEPWHYYVSWTTGTPTHFPESWFWFNFRESVMALTYEDMNCEAAGNYQQTAYALLHGIADYLGLVSTILITDIDEVSGNFSLDQNYPNPVRLSKNSSASTVIQYQLKTSQRIKLSLFDVLGRQVRVIESGFRGPGIHRIFIDVSNLANGTYFYQLQTSGGRQIKQLNILR